MATARKKSEDAQQCVARWVHRHAIPFNAVDSDEFRKMCEAIGKVGPGFEPPSQNKLRDMAAHFHEIPLDVRMEVEDGGVDVTQCWPKQPSPMQKKDKLYALINEVKVKLHVKHNELRHLVEKVNELNEIRGKQVQLRKEAHNKVLDEQGNIRIFCRCRPLMPPSVMSSSIRCNDDKDTIEFWSEKDTKYYLEETFRFEYVFTEEDGQAEVFREISPYVTHVLDGGNLCLLAYGQTGSGKTFTMQGSKDDGLYHRICDNLFRDIGKVGELISYSITVSVIEIYDNKVFDLMSDERTRIKIRNDGQGHNQLSSLTEIPVHNLEEVLNVINKGTKKRKTASTKANATSSRSHALVLLKVAQTNKLNNTTATSKLWMIDLAGSEKGSEADSKQINDSLLQLSNVMFAKSNNLPPIFRNSTLTRILEDSLNDEGSKIIMITHISRAEANLSESIRTIRFAVTTGEVRISCASPKFQRTTPGKMLYVTSQSRYRKEGGQGSCHGNDKTTTVRGKENMERFGRPLSQQVRKMAAMPASSKKCGVAPLEAASISSSNLIKDLYTTHGGQAFWHLNDKATMCGGKENKEGIGRPLIQQWNKPAAMPAEEHRAVLLESIQVAEAGPISSSDVDVVMEEGRLHDEIGAAQQILKDNIDAKIPHFELPPGVTAGTETGHQITQLESPTSKTVVDDLDVRHAQSSNLEIVDPLVEQYSDSELEEILTKWAKNGELHNEIIEFDIYKCSPEEWKRPYYLVKLETVKNGKKGKYNRKFIGGVWKKSHRKTSAELKASTKWQYSFYREGSTKNDSSYRMFEYVLLDGPQDHVLCHIIHGTSVPREAQVVTTQDLKDIEMAKKIEESNIRRREELSILESELLRVEKDIITYEENKQKLESQLSEEKVLTEEYTQQLVQLRASKVKCKKKKVQSLTRQRSQVQQGEQSHKYEMEEEPIACRKANRKVTFQL